MTFAGFETFLIKNSPLKVVFMTHLGCPSHHARGRKRRKEECRGNGHHGLPMV